MTVGNYESKVLVILSERLRDHKSILLHPCVELGLLFSLRLSQVFGLYPGKKEILVLTVFEGEKFSLISYFEVAYFIIHD